MNDIILKIAENPDDYEIVAVGDKKRFSANKLLLGKNAIYASDMNFPLIEKYVIAIHGEYHTDKIINNYTFHISELIDLKAKKFWDNKKEYKGVDPNHDSSNKNFINKSQKWPFEKYIIEIFERKKAKLKCLSVGCGTGSIERLLLSYGFFDLIIGADISTDSIDVAKYKAKDVDPDGIIQYEVKNMNKDNLGNEEYDIIIAQECVHHIERLEFFYKNIHNALKPGGIFLQSEYIGQARFQHTYNCIMAVNFVLLLWPPYYKKSSFYRKPKLIDVIRSDPSEAVRSNEIISLTNKFFSNTRIHNMVGIVRHLAFQVVKADKFNQDNLKHKIRSGLFTRMCSFSERLFCVKPANAYIISQKDN